MAHSISSRKRVRQNATRRALNRSRTTALKSELRKATEALSAGDANAEARVREAIAAVDRAGTQRTLHPNAAARRKSALARKLNALKQKSS